MSENTPRACALAQDLMPLHLDHLCSPESSRFLQEHLQACEKCRALYRDMQTNYSPAPRAPEGESDVSRFRRFIRRHTFRRALIAVAAALGALVIVYGLYAGLWLDKSHPLSLSRYDVGLRRTSDGWVFPAFSYAGGDGYVGGIGMGYGGIAGEGVMYVCQASSLIPERNKNGGEYIDPCMYLHEGVLYLARYEANRGEYWIALEGRVEEIRQGTDRDYKVVYRAGDDIPLCSAEQEEAINEQLWNQVYGHQFTLPDENALFVPLPGERE